MVFNLKFSCSKDETYRYLGYDSKTTQNWPKVDQIYEELYNHLGTILTPTGYLKTYPLSWNDNRATAHTKPLWILPGQDIQNNLQNCQKITLLGVTLGLALDFFLAECLKRDEYTKAVMADAMGSAAAEEAANRLNGLLAKDAKAQGYSLKSRYSPGYGDLPLFSNEQILLGLKEDGPCIEMLPSGLLKPRKSITALIGWRLGITTEVPNALNCSNNCSACSLSNCLFRKKDFTLKDV